MIGIIITFDVGGRIYRVAKDVLQKFPNTVLCTLASDIDSSNEDNPIFIDRNDDRFQYVLDYMRDVNNSSFNLTSTINQDAFFNDMEYYGFRCDYDIYFPTDVKHVDGIQFQYMKWDTTRGTCDLAFETKNHVVTCTSGDKMEWTWRSVMGTIDFTEGVHFWNVMIVEDMGLAPLIGVAYQLPMTHTNHVKGYNPNFDGAGYDGSDGHRLYKGKKYRFGPFFEKNDIIGVLLNMDKKTVTFHKNGIRVGTAGECLTGTTHTPFVSFAIKGQKIGSVSHNKIFTPKIKENDDIIGA